jgi:restriction system protein
MAIWLIRAGSHGEFAQKFIDARTVYITWNNLDLDLSKLPDKQKLLAKLDAEYPNSKPKKLHNWVSQPTTTMNYG